MCVCALLLLLLSPCRLFEAELRRQQEELRAQRMSQVCACACALSGGKGAREGWGMAQKEQSCVRVWCQPGRTTGSRQGGRGVQTRDVCKSALTTPCSHCTIVPPLPPTNMHCPLPPRLQCFPPQVGTGDRSEKIKTYNYKDSRVSDHRLKQNYDLNKQLDGEIEDNIQVGGGVGGAGVCGWVGGGGWWFEEWRERESRR